MGFDLPAFRPDKYMISVLKALDLLLSDYWPGY